VISAEHSKRPVLVLSLDGGGIRGIGQAYLLSLSVASLAKKHWTTRPTPHLVAGSSTGAITAFLLSEFGHEPTFHVASRFYQEHGLRIFPRGLAAFWNRLVARLFEQGLLSSVPKYRTSGLSNALLAAMCEANDIRCRGTFALSAWRLRTLITAYSLTRRRPRFFKSWQSEATDTCAISALTASAAAPTYFDSVPVASEGLTERLIDGGVVANNPAACAYAEARRLWPDRPIRVLSIGTGHRRDPIEHTSAAGLLQWAPDIVQLLMEGPQEAVDYQMRAGLGDNYLRLDFPLPPGVGALDDARPEHIEAILNGAARWASSEPGVAAMAKARTWWRDIEGDATRFHEQPNLSPGPDRSGYAEGSAVFASAPPMGSGAGPVPATLSV
jgi:uncharacterized protein